MIVSVESLFLKRGRAKLTKSWQKSTKNGKNFLIEKYKETEKMKKKALSLTLTFITAIAMFVLGFATMFAPNVKAETVTSVATETELVAAFKDGGSYSLGEDIVLNETVEIPSGKTVTLDLNGNNVTVAESTGKHIYAFNNKGTLTIRDSKGNGYVSARGIYNGFDGSVDGTVAGATLTIESGAYVGVDKDGGAAIFNCANLVINGGSFEGEVAAINNRVQGTTTINGGTFRSGNYDESIGIVTYAIQNHGGSLTINNATVDKGFGAIGQWGGTTVVEGGNFTPKGTKGTSCHVVYVGSGDLTIKDGNFVMNYPADAVPANGSAVYGVNSNSITINGGNFTGATDTVTGNAGTVVYGGTYATAFGDSEGVWEYVPDSNKSLVDTITYKAKSGDLYYESLQDAFNDGGKNITLLQNIEYSNGYNDGETIKLESNKTVTLDLNGKTIKQIIKDNGLSAVAFAIRPNANLTIKDSVGGGKIIACSTAFQLEGTLNLESGTISISNPTAYDKSEDGFAYGVWMYMRSETNPAPVFNMTGGAIEISDELLNAHSAKDCANAVAMDEGVDGVADCYKNAIVNITGGEFDGTIYGHSDADVTVPAGTMVNGEVNVTNYSELVDAVSNGKAVRLQNDITATGAIDATDGSINLNGKVLTLTVGDNNFFGESTIRNGSVCITNCVAAGDCIIGIGDYSNSATLNLNDVNLYGDGYSSAYAVLYVYNSSTLNINGGSIVVANENASAGGVIKAHSADNGKINIVGTEDDPVELKFTNAKIGMLDGTTLFNYVDLDIVGGANAINQTALTVKNSTIDITGADGRGITLKQGDVIVENSDINLSNCSEGEIRFKESLTLSVDQDSTISDCTIYADASATEAKVNDTLITASEDEKANIKVENGTTNLTCSFFVNGVGYTNFDKALSYAKTLTGDVTFEVYDKATLTTSLGGAYDSITFVGKHTDAEIYLNYEGYITATGKTVNFVDLKLSKSVGGFIGNAGFMNVAFGVYDVVEVNYTNCTFLNGSYASAGKVTYTNCTFYKSHEKYGLWAYGNVDVTVDGGKFSSLTAGDDNIRGIKMYAEGGKKTTDLTVKDVDFSEVNGKPAIVLTYGESVTFEGDSSFSSTGVFELDADGAPNGTAIDVSNATNMTDIACNSDDYDDCGVIVDGKIYRTVSEAKDEIKTGSTVTLMYDSTEDIELPYGVTFNDNGYDTTNITFFGMGGEGTIDNPYTISNLTELKWFRDSVNTYTQDGSNQYKNKYIVLTADINLNGENWTPIGTNSVGDHAAFLGIFDGQGHTISNLYVNANGGNLGFFARTGAYGETGSATIKNVTFNNVDVSTNNTNHWATGHGDNVGGVIGNANAATTIENVHVTGDVYVVGCGYVGGIVGHGYPKIYNSSVKAEDGSYIHGHYWCVGGIIGYAGEGGTVIDDCSVEGVDIWTAYGAGAGIAGLANGGNTINNVSVKDVAIESNSDYYMGYVAGNGEENSVSNVTLENVTATAQGNPISSTDAVAEINGEIYFDLQQAINAVQDGETIVVLRDVVVTAPAYGQNALNYDRTIDFTIDLDGHTITSDVGNSVFRFNITNSGATSDVTVTLKNGSVVSGANTWCAIMAAGVSEDARFILNLEDLDVENYKAGDLAIKAWSNALINANRVDVVSNYGGGFYAVGGEIILTDCTVEQEGLHTAPYTSMAFAVSNGGKLTVNSGTYSATPKTAQDANNQGTSHGSWVGGVMNSGGTLIINGGTFANGNYGDDNLATYARGIVLADTDAKLYISGGEFNAIGKIIDYQNNLGVASKNPVVEVSGGTFSSEVEEKFLKEGFSLNKNANGTYGVQYSVFEVGAGKQFATLADAVAFVKANGFYDVTFVIYGEIEFNPVTTDGNNSFHHGIADFGVFDHVTIKGGDADATLVITGGGVPDIKNATLENLTFVDEGTYATTANEFMYQNFIDTTFNKVTFKDGVRLSGDSKVIDCVFDVNTYNEYAIWLDDGDFAISGSTVVAGEDSYGLVKSDSAETLEITNNTFEYLGVANKEALNVKGVAITANGNTFIDCIEGVLPLDKINYAGDGATELKNEEIVNASTIVTHYAKIGDEKYLTVRDAFNDAEAGDTIVILLDVEDLGALTVKTGVTLDGNGKTISGNSAIYMNAGAKVTGVTFKDIKNANGTLSAIYAIRLAGRVEIVNNVFDSVEYDAIQITPADGAEIVITDNVFKGVSKRYVHIESVRSENVAFKATVTANKMYSDNAVSPLDVYYFADESLINVASNYIADTTNVCVLNANAENLAVKALPIMNEDLTAERSIVAYVLDQYGVRFYDDLSSAVSELKANETLYILEGSYNINLSINKQNATVIGELGDNGERLVTINGKLSVTADGVTIKNLKVYSPSENITGYINAKNVLIENCYVEGQRAFRNCYTTGLVTFKDSTLIGTVYGIHFDGSAGGEIVIDNCTIVGWTSFARTIKKVTMTETKFEEGNYNYVRFYQEEVVIEDCTFNEEMAIDISNDVQNADVTVNNSTFAGGTIEDLFEGADMAYSNIVVDDVKLIRNVRIDNANGASFFKTLQEALDAVTTGDNEITLLADCDEDVIISQVEGVNIVLNGNDKTYTGTINIYGNSRYTGAETLTIKNFKFETNEFTHDFIWSDNAKSGQMRYAHNVTIKDSSFAYVGTDTTNEVVGIRIRQGYDVAVENVTANNLHSLLQGTGISGVAFNDVTITDAKEGGISLGTSFGVTINDANINAPQYGIRANGSGKYKLSVTNSNITANIPVAVRDAKGEYELTLSGNTLTANNAEGYKVVFTNDPKEEDNFVAPTGSITLIVDGAMDGAVYGMQARVNGIYYADFFLALNSAVDGDTINLLKDITVDEKIIIENAIVLNGNGYTVNSTADRAINVDCAGDVEIKNLTVIGGGNSVTDRGINVIQKPVELTLNKVEIRGVKYGIKFAKSCGNATVNVNDSVVTGYIAVEITSDGATLNAEDTEFIGINDYDGAGNDVAVIQNSIDSDNTTVKVVGGKIEAVKNGTAGICLIGEIETAGSLTAVLDTELIAVDSITGFVDVDDVELTVRATYAQDLMNEGYAIEDSSVSGLVSIRGEAVAKVGTTTYLTLAEAVDAVKDETNPVIELLTDATFDITAWEMIKIGGDNAQTVTINGNGNTLTFNKLNSDWNHIVTGNDAKLILNDMTLEDSGYNNGPWNRYDINFACDVELNNVVSNKPLAFKANATLNNVEVNDVKTKDAYAIWIQANGQTVEINGLEVSAGRGIKVDEQYVDAQKVTLGIANATFDTEKKSAILIKSEEGATVHAQNVDITNVKADNENLVWVDSDSASHYGEVQVSGSAVSNGQTIEAKLLVEEIESYTAGIVENGNIVGYYATIQEAINDAKAGTTEIILLADSDEDVTVSQVEGVNIVLNGNDKTYSGTITIHGNSRHTGAETLTIKNFKFETNEFTHDFIWSDKANGIDGSVVRYAHNVTIKDSSFAYVGTDTTNAVVGIRIRQGYDVAVENVTANNLHSLLQGTGISGVAFNDVTITDAKEGGISLGTSFDVEINEATITGAQYGIRANGEGEYELTVENSNITAEYPIVVRQAKGDYILNVENNVLNATNVDGYGIVFTNGAVGTLDAPTGKVTLNGNVGDDTISGMVAKVGTTYYAQLQDAINAIDNGTITLVADREISDTITVANGKTITLDLNGKTLSMETGDDTKTALINNYGNLTIDDNSAYKNGTLSYHYTGNNNGDAYNTIETAPGSVLTVKAGKIENLSTCLIAYAIDGLTNGTLGDVTVNVEGGVITSKKQSIRIFANSTTNKGTLNISGGEMHGRVIIQNANTQPNKAELNISGGVFNTNAYKDEVLYIGGTQGAYGDIDAGVSDGTFGGMILSTSNENFITGGTFAKEVEKEYLAEGFGFAEINGYYEVRFYPIHVAYADGSFGYFDYMTNGVGYVEKTGDTTANSRYKVAVPFITDFPKLEGATITLHADIIDAGIRFVENDMTLDLNGHTYTINEGTGSNTTRTQAFQVRNEVTTSVTIKNGTIAIAPASEMNSTWGKIAYFFHVYTNIVLDSVKIDMTNMSYDVYGQNVYGIVVSTGNDSITLTGNTEFTNFDESKAGAIASSSGTIVLEDPTALPGEIKLNGYDAVLVAPAGMEDSIIVRDGDFVRYENGQYNVYKIIAKIDNVCYSSLQDAINDAKVGTTEIILSVDCDEDVTVSQEIGKNIVLDGDGKTYSGTITIHGNSRNSDETLTIKNFNFVTSEAEHVSINSYFSNAPGRYAHNVTIMDSTFTATGAAYGTAPAIKINQAYNIKIEGVTANGMHSLLQASAIEGLEITGVTVNGKRGLSLGTSFGVKITDTNINVEKYGIRANGSDAYDLTIENSTIVADIPVAVRDAKGEYELTLSGNTLTANNAEGYKVVFTNHATEEGIFETPTGDVKLIVDGAMDGAIYGMQARVGNTYYNDFFEALNNANANDTIVILRTVVLDSDVTIDLTNLKVVNSGNVLPLFRVQNDANVTVKGGEITNSYAYVFILGASDSSTAGNLTIESGTYYGVITVVSVTRGELTIEGGNFSAKLYNGDNRYLINCIDEAYRNGTAKVTIIGGTFTNFDPANNLAEGAKTDFVPKEFATVLNNGAYEVVEAEAYIGEVGYADFFDALANAEDGDTIVVLKTVVIEEDKDIDLTNLTVVNGANILPLFRVQNNANVTIKGGEITNNYAYVFILGASDSSTAGNLTIESGTYYGVITVVSVTRGELTIEGGNFSAKLYNGDNRYLINCIDEAYRNGTAKVTIIGGTFTNFDPANNLAEGAKTDFVPKEYTTVLNNGVFEVVEADAYIGEVGYLTLYDAIDNAVDGDVINLIKDVELASIKRINGKSFTIEGNDHVISGAGALRFEDSNVEIKNVVFDGFTQTAGNGILEFVYSTATITNCKFVENDATSIIAVDCDADSDGDSVVTISDSTFEKNNCSLAVINVSEGNAIINDCKIVDNQSNIAVIYTSSDTSIVGCYFAGNTLTGTNANKAIVLAGPYRLAKGGEFEVVINENAFLDDELAVFVENFAVAYDADSTFNLNGNYWNGEKPIVGVFDKPAVVLENYYTAITINGEDFTLTDRVNVILHEDDEFYHVTTILEYIDMAYDRLVAKVDEYVATKIYNDAGINGFMEMLGVAKADLDAVGPDGHAEDVDRLEKWHLNEFTYVLNARELQTLKTNTILEVRDYCAINYITYKADFVTGIDTAYTELMFLEIVASAMDKIDELAQDFEALKLAKIEELKKGDNGNDEKHVTTAMIASIYASKNVNELEEAVAVAKTEIEQIKKYKSLLDDLKELADKNAEDIALVIEKLELLNGAVGTDYSDLLGKLNTALSKIDEVKGVVDQTNGKVATSTELSQVYDRLTEQLNNNYDGLKTALAKEMAEVRKLVEANGTALKTLGDELKELENANTAAVTGMIETLTTNLNTLRDELIGTDGELTSMTATLEAISKRLSTEDGSLFKDIITEVGTILDQKLATLSSTYLDPIEEAIIDLKNSIFVVDDQDNLTSIVELIGSTREDIANVKEVVDNIDTDMATGEDIANKYAELVKILNNNYDGLKTALAKEMAEVRKLVEANGTALKTLGDELKELENANTAAVTGMIETLTTNLNTLRDELIGTDGELTSMTATLEAISKRLSTEDGSLFKDIITEVGTILDQKLATLSSTSLDPIEEAIERLSNSIFNIDDQDNWTSIVELIGSTREDIADVKEVVDNIDTDNSVSEDIANKYAELVKILNNNYDGLKTALAKEMAEVRKLVEANGTALKTLGDELKELENANTAAVTGMIETLTTNLNTLRDELIGTDGELTSMTATLEAISKRLSTEDGSLFKDIITEVGNILDQKLATLSDTSLDSIEEAIVDLKNSIFVVDDQDNWTSIVELVNASREEIAEVEDAVSDIDEYLKDNDVAGKLSALVAQLGSIETNILSGMKTQINTIDGAVSSINSTLGSLAPTITDMGNTVGVTSSKVQNILTAIQNLGTFDLGDMPDNIEDLIEKVDDITERIKEGGDLVTEIVDGVEDLVQDLADAANTAAQSANNAATAANTAAQTATNIANQAQAVATAAKQIAEQAQAAANEATAAAQTATTAASNAVLAAQNAEQAANRLGDQMDNAEEAAIAAKAAAEAAEIAAKAAEAAAKLAAEKQQTAEVKQYAVISTEELETWIKGYVDDIIAELGLNGEQTAFNGVVAYAAVSDNTNAFRAELEEALGKVYTANNKRLVLAYYDQALAQITTATTKAEINYALETFKANVALVDTIESAIPEEKVDSLAIVSLAVEILIAIAIVFVIVYVARSKRTAVVVAPVTPDDNTPNKDDVIEEVVVTATAEEVVEEPVEETTEEVVEEPAEETPAVEETADEEAEEGEDDSDEEESSEETSPFASLGDRTYKTFEQRLIEADDQTRENYKAIITEFGSYKKVRARMSKKCVSIRTGRTLLAKITLRGKTLKGYMALDPNAFEITVYHHKDMGEKKAYQEVPMMVKVRSPRSVKKAVRLINELANKFNLERLPEDKIMDNVFAMLGKKPYKTFERRLKEADEQTKANYQTIIDEFTSFKKVKARMSKRYVSIRSGRKLLAKITLRGKSLKGYLALDPNEFEITVYHHKNMGDKKAYQEVPMMIKVRSPRSVKKAVRLINEIATKFELVKKA